VKPVRIALIIALCASATEASAQDFLGALARRAAETAGARLAERAVDGAVNGAARPAPSEAAPRRRGQPDAGAQAAPDPALDRLTPQQREAECDRRVPLDAGGGRSYAKQEAFIACMGPRYGEGG
jgi:hypothetical protein